MSFESVFGKSAKIAVQDFKAMAQQMIANNCNFSLQCLNIYAPSEDSTIYPSHEELSEWIKKFMMNELKSKPLNQKALEEMAKKGIQQKKQPLEILLVSIIPSSTHIHIGVSLPVIKPENMSELILFDFVSSVLNKYDSNSNLNLNHIKFIEFIDNFAFVNIPHHEPLKERDVVLRYFFKELKSRKIYIEEDEEEVIFME